MFFFAAAKIFIAPMYRISYKNVSLHKKNKCMSTIIINNASKEQVNVISKLARLLNLNITTNKPVALNSKAAIDAAIEAYENGSSKGLKISVKDFKQLVNGAKKNN